MERWVRGRAAENGTLLYPSGFAIAPFFETMVLISGAFFISAFSLKIGCPNWLNLY